MSWQGDIFTADDGRVFVMFSEHARGEDRWYEARLRVPDGTGDRGDFRRDWKSIGGSCDKRTERRRVERYVRENPIEGGL